MPPNPPWKPSEYCFRTMATLLVLSGSAGAGGCATQNREFSGVAAVLALWAGVAFVIGLILVIWDK
jgi:hypothetical protein